jgi:hypothetical protein
MIESPKKRFLKSPHVNRLLDIVSDPALIAGLDAAVLQFQWEAGAARTPETAAALHWQLTGVQRMAELIQTIAVVPPPKPKLSSDNLPHEI